jgi:hypothetical protein
MGVDLTKKARKILLAGFIVLKIKVMLLFYTNVSRKGCKKMYLSIMQRYSLGIQDFSVLRENNCVYVDKTEQVYRLITQLKCVFLARPCRFE